MEVTRKSEILHKIVRRWALVERVPPFRLPDQKGKQRSLRDLAGPGGLLLVFSRSADW